VNAPVSRPEAIGLHTITPVSCSRAHGRTSSAVSRVDRAERRLNGVHRADPLGGAQLVDAVVRQPGRADLALALEVGEDLQGSGRAVQYILHGAESCGRVAFDEADHRAPKSP
jgi:hypothetical protein